MRFVSLTALLLSTVALTACGGGGGGFSAATLADNGGVCTINDTSDACKGKTDPDPDPNPDTDPDPDPDGDQDGDGDPDTGTGTDNQGNSTDLSTGDKTIIIEKSKLKMTEANPGLSNITTIAGTATTAGSAKIVIDTKQSDEAEAKWPKAKDMEEYEAGSAHDDFQVTPDQLGANGGYKEYRALSYGDTEEQQDEVLQLWNFGESHIAQYRNITSGGEAGMQAWTFGGTKATAMPTGGSANYSGRYGATAKTENWTNNDGALTTVAADNLWSITGQADATANFNTGTFNAKLTPETWRAWQSLNSATGFTNMSAADTTSDNFYGFMDDKVYIKGTIAGNEIVGSANISTMEDINGDNIANDGLAATDPDYLAYDVTGNKNAWVTNQSTNPFYGAFFGTNGTEVAGVFNLDAVAPSPAGGDLPINDDRRGFISMSGALHVE